MISYDLLATLCSFLVLIYAYDRAKKRKCRNLPLPPGPTKRFLVGNLFDVPKESPWIRYHELCREHKTDILHLDMMGTSLIILDTAEAAMELLEKRSAIYSGRPEAPMITLIGCEKSMSFLDYERKFAHQAFHLTASKKFRPYTLKAAHSFLRSMRTKPDKVVENLRYMAGESVISITYGLDLLPENDPYIQLNEAAVKPVFLSAMPGRFLIDFIPVLKYVLAWMPGAAFKRKAKTSTAIVSCILGHLTRPDIVTRAQVDIDAIVPFGELPTFEFEERLPLITAICMEALRWRVITPIGMPHVVAVDDVYKGYTIPKGSIVVANVWALLHDEEIYLDPSEFKPERFMKDGKINKEVRDPAHAAFGFGRQICPGQFLAFSSMWITVASLLAAFDITKAVDDLENIIEPDYEHIPGLVCLPKPFKCSMKPRSRLHEEAIKVTDGEEVQFEY
ncbi:hypothetical protein AMATHDRAFT_77275 [Amanita thiersii Skay4041]|uniref:Cytochrome P450 n=1 Tax=Amanita thiersii Skay4041 TaxID=703135 RepID=A0A2A9NHZ6_9AGAR|nr:hypothetical protein AMATHDRAFT_77275 [Amanita thiersii Skay4041]